MLLVAKVAVCSHINTSSSSSCPWSVSSVILFLNIQLKLGPPTLPRSSRVPSSFRSTLNASFGSLYVSILCTCCSHLFWVSFISFTINYVPVFSLIIWFFLYLILSIHKKIRGQNVDNLNDKLTVHTVQLGFRWWSLCYINRSVNTV